MTRDEARRVLGVPSGASVAELRSAFRRELLRHHPDVAGAAGAGRTHEIVVAYRVLRVAGGEAPAPAPPAPPRSPRRPRVAVEAIGDTIALALPRREAFLVLLEAGHGLGEVAYLDPSAGLLETVVVFEDFPVCSVVITLEGPLANGTTEACCTVEALTGGRPPPAAGVAALVADRVRALLT